MVGTGLEVLLHPFGDGFDVAAGADRVDQPIASTSRSRRPADRVDQPVAAAVGQVGLGEAEAQQVVALVRGEQVAADCSRCVKRARSGPGSRTTACSTAKRVRPHSLAGRQGVRRGHEVRVRVPGPLGG
ncbi:hypothetical protein [Saccharopolyspora pogona]|uniref:hypothetical protein n=1 Tax=Saccharopolyspora pogona TaxID=333966 RepID=UPI001688A430|nr:hypothetical protein [Saccharopolyspora pogona]